MLEDRVFRDVTVTVGHQPQLVFRFPVALSLISLLVCNAREEVFWDFIAEEFEPVATTGGSFQSWPIEEAPPELLAMLASMQEKADRELSESGPRKLPIAEVVYGSLPAGYRETTDARLLPRGEYNVLVTAEQGQGACRFSIADG
jgi:hypothetical protein